MRSMEDDLEQLHSAAMGVGGPLGGGSPAAEAVVDATSICAPQEETFGPGALIVLAVYTVFLICIAAYGHFRSGSSTMSSHFLAGSGLGSVVLSFSLFATAFSGYTLLGVPGSAYREGYGAFVWVHTACTVTTTQLFVAPRLYRLARLRGYITPCCYIRERYNNVFVTSLVTACYLVPMAIYVLAQIKSISTLMGSLTGSKQLAVASTGVLTAIMLLYESLGGLKSVAWTDVAQGVLLLSGFFCMFGIAEAEFGGLNHAGFAMRGIDPEFTEVPLRPCPPRHVKCFRCRSRGRPLSSSTVSVLILSRYHHLAQSRSFAPAGICPEWCMPPSTHLSVFSPPRCRHSGAGALCMETVRVAVHRSRNRWPAAARLAAQTLRRAPRQRHSDRVHGARLGTSLRDPPLGGRGLGRHLALSQPRR